MTLLTVNLGGVKHGAHQPQDEPPVTLCGIDVWGLNGFPGEEIDCPKCLVELERRWTVVCPNTASCGWRGFRVAPSLRKAQEKPCPHCGEHVRASDQRDERRDTNG